MGSVSTEFTIKPFKDGLSFGAEIYGLNINHMTDKQVKRLKEAIMTYLVIVVKGQQNELPRCNWELLQRLDPEAPEFTDDEWAKMYNPDGEGILVKLGYSAVPNAGRLYVIGKGYQGEDHYGLKDMNLGEAFADSWYYKPLPVEDFKNGISRFQSWHMDGPGYKINPPIFSSFRCIKFPQGVQTVDWADGSGLTKKVKAGRTAFLNTAQLYEMFTEEEKTMADHSWAEYMYYPYEWILGCRGNPNGLNIACEGREVPDQIMEAMPRDPRHQLFLPLVWMNSVTGKKHFQVQPNIVRRLHIRNGPGEKPRVIDNLKELRDFLNTLQERVIVPENIYVGPEEEGDHLLWYNWGVMHSKIDYPVEFGPRTAHQGWMASSKAPTGPVPIPGQG